MLSAELNVKDHSCNLFAEGGQQVWESSCEEVEGYNNNNNNNVFLKLS